MSKDKPTQKSKKKNETKTVSSKDVVKDVVKDASKSPAEKSDVQNAPTGKVSSEAGKGDKLRRGISQDEWGEKWEKIFGLNFEN